MKKSFIESTVPIQCSTREKLVLVALVGLLALLSIFSVYATISRVVYPKIRQEKHLDAKWIIEQHSPKSSLVYYDDRLKIVSVNSKKRSPHLIQLVVERDGAIEIFQLRFVAWHRKQIQWLPRSPDWLEKYIREHGL